MPTAETIANFAVTGIAAGIPASLTIVLVKSNLSSTKDAREGWQTLWEAASEQAARALEENARLREENGALRAEVQEARAELRALRRRMDNAGIGKPWDGRERRSGQREEP